MKERQGWAAVVKTMTLRKFLIFRRTFVALFLVQLMLCGGVFDSIALCFEKDGSFHIVLSPCGDEGETSSGKELPIASFEHDQSSTSDDCDSCTDKHIHACMEDCEYLTLGKSRINLNKVLSAATFQPSILLLDLPARQPYHGYRQPHAAYAARDSIKTVVLLN